MGKEILTLINNNNKVKKTNFIAISLLFFQG